MLSNEYRQRLNSICDKIAKGEGVDLPDMIWAQKLAKANRSAYEILQKARRKANMGKEPNGLDTFLNDMNLGDPDPSNHKTAFDGADDIADWFRRDDSDDWRQRD